MPSSRSFAPALAALLVGITLVPALRAQPASDSPESLVAPSPAGVVAEHRPTITIAREIPAEWTRSLARADSLASRKHAFHVGAAAGVVVSSGFVLAVVQPWKDDCGENRCLDWRDVALPMLVAAIPGALLGGVAGVIVHDVHGAVSRD